MVKNAPGGLYAKLIPVSGSKGLAFARRKTDGGGYVSVLAVRLGQRWLAVPTRHVSEVMERRPVMAVPHRMGEIVEGMVNLRGELLMVISLESLMGQEPATGRARRMLVIRHPSGRFVFSADEVYAGVRYAPEAVKSLPAPCAVTGFSCISGIFEWNGCTIGILDVEALVQVVNRRLA